MHFTGEHFLINSPTFIWLLKSPANTYIHIPVAQYIYMRPLVNIYFADSTIRHVISKDNINVILDIWGFNNSYRTFYKLNSNQ